MQAGMIVKAAGGPITACCLVKRSSLGDVLDAVWTRFCSCFFPIFPYLTCDLVGCVFFQHIKGCIYTLHLIADYVLDSMYGFCRMS